MAQPLESTYDWRPPLALATVALTIGIALLARGQAVGWVTAAAVLLGCYGLYVLVVWVRTQAYVLVDGPVLTLRNVRTLHRVDGSSVVKISQVLTAQGPSYTLTIRDEDGRLLRRRVPTARLRRGHSTLFGWILAWAPQAELDRGSRRTLQTLRERGALPHPDDVVPNEIPAATDPKQTDRD